MIPARSLFETSSSSPSSLSYYSKNPKSSSDTSELLDPVYRLLLLAALWLAERRLVSRDSSSLSSSAFLKGCNRNDVSTYASSILLWLKVVNALTVA